MAKSFLLIKLEPSWLELSVTLSREAAEACSAIHSNFYKNKLNTVRAYSSEKKVMEKNAVELTLMCSLPCLQCIISQFKNL